MPMTARLDALDVVHQVMIWGMAGVGFSVERGNQSQKTVIMHLKDKLLNFERASRFTLRSSNLHLAYTLPFRSQRTCETVQNQKVGHYCTPFYILLENSLPRHFLLHVYTWIGRSHTKTVQLRANSASE
jgi:hypothetical protein